MPIEQRLCSCFRLVFGDDSIREIQVQPLNPLYVQILQQKIDELKETSGTAIFHRADIRRRYRCIGAIGLCRRQEASYRAI